MHLKQNYVDKKQRGEIWWFLEFASSNMLRALILQTECLICYQKSLKNFELQTMVVTEIQYWYNIDTKRYNAWPLGTKWPKITILLCYSKSWHSDIGHDNQTHVPMQATCLSFPLAFQFRPSQEWIKDVYVNRRQRYSNNCLTCVH